MVPLNHLLIIGTIIFLIGILGVLIRRNVIIILMSIELILNGVNIILVSFSYYLNSIKGHIFVLFIITVAVAEAALCFGLIVAFMRNKDTFDIDQMNIMKG